MQIFCIIKYGKLEMFGTMYNARWKRNVVECSVNTKDAQHSTPLVEVTM